MKTTLEIDPELLKQAKKALGTATIKDTVHKSLGAVVRRQKLRALGDSLGHIPLDLTAERLLGQRKKRLPHVSR